MKLSILGKSLQVYFCSTHVIEYLTFPSNITISEAKPVALVFGAIICHKDDGNIQLIFFVPAVPLICTVIIHIISYLNEQSVTKG